MEIQIENLTTCSAACHFCVYPSVAAERAGQVMTMELFHKIINEVGTIPQIDLIKITGLSEPTLDPKLEDRIRYAKEKAPQCRVEIYTHGAHLIPKRFDSLKSAGLNSLVFSLNAVNQEQHEKVMGLKGKFDSTCRNIEYAIENRGAMHVEIHTVYNDDQFGRAHAEEFYKRWGHRAHGGFGVGILEGNWAGDNRTTRVFQPNEHCYRATTQVYILADGRVATCCFDPTGKQTFGDLNTNTIREIYNADKYLNFRLAHVENRADEYPICANCTRI